MSGYDKLKPVVNGNCENPHCFKNVNKANLPAYYRHNKSAWMTTKIFDEWLQKINTQFKSQKRNIILFVDNFSGHRQQTLSNVKIEFFPANMTSVLQPCDLGVISSFKMKYRSLIMRTRLESIEYASTEPILDIKTAIYNIKTSWDSVTPQTINRCFKKGGFNKDTSDDEPELIESTDANEIEYEKVAADLSKKIDFDKYAFKSCDNNVPSCEPYSDALVMPDAVEELFEETEQAPIKMPSSSKEEALKGLNTALDFLTSSSDDYSIEIDRLLGLVETIKSNERKKQSKITSFFSLSSMC